MDQQATAALGPGQYPSVQRQPRNVTLSGESSGGLIVLSQLVSPGARGLFARAIVESGTYDLTQATLATARSRARPSPPRSAAPARARPTCARFDGTGQQMLSLVPPRPQVETGFAAEHHCAFWAIAG
jgi:hypothetical protein